MELCDVVYLPRHRSPDASHRKQTNALREVDLIWSCITFERAAHYKSTCQITTPPSLNNLKINVVVVPTNVPNAAPLPTKHTSHLPKQSAPQQMKSLYPSDPNLPPPRCVSWHLWRIIIWSQPWSNSSRLIQRSSRSFVSPAHRLRWRCASRCGERMTPPFIMGWRARLVLWGRCTDCGIDVYGGGFGRYYLLCWSALGSSPSSRYRFVAPSCQLWEYHRLFQPYPARRGKKLICNMLLCHIIFLVTADLVLIPTYVYLLQIGNH